MKVVDLNCFGKDRKLIEAFKNEMKIMKTIDHPRIIHLHDKIYKDKIFYLITTYCSGGNLEELLFQKYPNGLKEP